MTGQNVMKIKRNIIVTVLTILGLFTTIASDNLFSGTWCIGDERLVITFKGKDSLEVSSLRDETIQGNGTYQKNDSTLFATVLNEDLELKMGYRYKKKDKSTIKTKIIFITVDGDSVNHPRRWMRMEKCDPDTFSIPEEDEEAEFDD